MKQLFNLGISNSTEDNRIITQLDSESLSLFISLFTHCLLGDHELGLPSHKDLNLSLKTTFGCF